jgi:predicted DNA-binding ribbon-helix-helix protein
MKTVIFLQSFFWKKLKMLACYTTLSLTRQNHRVSKLE